MIGIATESLIWDCSTRITLIARIVRHLRSRRLRPAFIWARWVKKCAAGFLALDACDRVADVPATRRGFDAPVADRCEPRGAPVHVTLGGPGNFRDGVATEPQS